MHKRKVTSGMLRCNKNDGAPQEKGPCLGGKRRKEIRLKAIAGGTRVRFGGAARCPSRVR